MSLSDTDKGGDSRTDPSLNTQDNLPAASTKAHSTDGVSNRAEAVAQVAKVVTRDDSILVYDTAGVARILIGIAPDGEIDIAASEVGVDITTLY